MKNINYLALGVWALLALMVLFAVLSYGSKQYQKGYSKGTEEVQRQYQEALAKQQEAINKASQDYEKQKAENEVKQDERQTQVTKIVKVPVYTNVCLDASGVRIINEAISSR
jgi:ABC-type transport system involved in cytochrome bd biosynthesis fused ATPase/permease subunit